MCMCRKYMYIQVMYQAKHTILLYTMAKFQKKSQILAMLLKTDPKKVSFLEKSYHSK